ncbi:MAG TPA: glycopeptide resistance accessory protein VanW [Petrotogaceae bacterium]|jgi:vancomycin resistance protein VanW|nr:glycopeptide resistance accessory protein VanW [Petrotogaceae bacterium]
MKKKRITQMFPWLLPLRINQRLLFFYTGMYFDGNSYASFISEQKLKYKIFEAGSLLYNHQTGFDMQYQENKVFNLKLAAQTLNNLIIRPQETFSFWKLVRYADKNIPYKDGLVMVDGKLEVSAGGGMCQMSNLLFWIFLHTPLTIVERHGHSKKDFPDTSEDMPRGVDATVAEGWLDLKVKNETDQSFQIAIDFDEKNIIGRIFSDVKLDYSYCISNAKSFYYRENTKIFEEVDVIQKKISADKGECICSKVLYRNKCEIGYPLEPEIKISEKGREKYGKIKYRRHIWRLFPRV